MLLREEYRFVHPDGYGHSRLCDLFRGFERRLSPTMRSPWIISARSSPSPLRWLARSARRRSSSPSSAVALRLRGSDLDADIAGWIDPHLRMCGFFGGIPRLIVPDNLKFGVNKGSFYDLEANHDYGI